MDKSTDFCFPSSITLEYNIIMKFFGNTVLVLLLFSLFLFSNSYSYAISGTPTIISYQGRLANSNGDLLGSSGTTYYFAFSIWDAASNGTQLWPSGNPATTTATVRQGVFNKDIDISDYNFNTNKDIYLEVKVSSSNIVFQTLSPRQRISSSVFSQLASAVSGIGQSSFGTTTPVSNSIVTIEATSTSAIPVLIRAFAGQIASLLRIEDSSLSHLFSINSSGGIFASSTLNVSGATTLYSALKVSHINSNLVPQLKLSQSGSEYGEFLVDSAGDLQLSLPAVTGGNFRMSDENLWVCSSGLGCGVDALDEGDKGNIIAETSVIFGNKFKFKLKINAGATTTTIMYDSLGNEVLEFDEDR